MFMQAKGGVEFAEVGSYIFLSRHMVLGLFAAITAEASLPR